MNKNYQRTTSNHLRVDRYIFDLVKRTKQGRATAMQEKSKGESATLLQQQEAMSLLDSPSNLRRCTTLASQESLKPSKQELELRKCLGEETFELILKSYSCAWQRDILVHGRLYITQTWICFYSNILGWETKTSIRLCDVTSIKKQKTAKLFPNAILIETGDKKFGFSSFYHRDKAYLVLLTVWDNSLLQQPLTGDCLRDKVKSIKVTKDQEKVLLSGTRSKSNSFVSEGSDIDTSQVNTPQFHHHTSSSETTAHTEDRTTTDTNLEQFDGGSFTGSSEQSAGSFDKEAGSSESSSETEWMPSQQSPLPDEVRMSPSLVKSESTLHPPTSSSSRGGSPNWIHHWKQNINNTSFYQKVLKLLSPEMLFRACSSAVLINILILIFIALLLLMTLSMVCYISQVEPALQPYLKWQPWCWLCSHDDPAEIELSMLTRAILNSMDPSTASTSTSTSLGQPP